MHNSISGTEAADRLAIRELIEAYALCADRRDAKKQMSLFTPDTHFRLHGLNSSMQKHDWQILFTDQVTFLLL
jgi:hypothetical protein